MSTAEIVNQLEELPEDKKQVASDFIAFLVSKTKAEKVGKVDTEKKSFLKVEGNPDKGFGSLKGKIWMSPDFDEPLDDFKDYM